MISLFQAIVALVLLGLVTLYYFKIRKSPEKPQEDTDDDIDPLEDLEPEPVEPVKTTPVVADEPDTNEEPEVVIISKPEPENEDKPVQPTPATTPAKPLIPTKPLPRPTTRLLTDKELTVLKQKVNNSFPRPRVPEDKKTPYDRKLEVYERCVMPIFINEFLDLARVEPVNDADVKLIMDPAKIQAKNASKGGFIPDRWEAVWKKTHDTRMTKLFNSCGPRPTPDFGPAKPLIPEKPKPTPAPKPRPEPEPEPEPEQPTPTTTPAKPIVPARPVVQPPAQQSVTVIGVRGKLASEGGYDLNNKTDRMTFRRASSADIHIEHVDVHRGDPANRNAYITFKYQDGTEHKFTFVGNGGLRFKKQDGSFGPNLGVGDASSVVLTGMGLPTNSYKIICTRITGRNTWHFRPLNLSKGLIGIDLSDNADWGGLRGTYVEVVS